MAWCDDQRQAWIAEMLGIYAFINREHLQRKFGISRPQASKDLHVFQRAQPGRMRYDATRKCYVAARPR
jgi:hypothetical protein